VPGEQRLEQLLPDHPERLLGRGHDTPRLHRRGEHRVLQFGAVTQDASRIQDEPLAGPAAAPGVQHLNLVGTRLAADLYLEQHRSSRLPPAGRIRTPGVVSPGGTHFS
jgi:hypothetical protein